MFRCRACHELRYHADAVPAYHFDPKWTTGIVCTACVHSEAERKRRRREVKSEKAWNAVGQLAMELA